MSVNIEDRIERVKAGSSGVVYTISRLLGGGSTLSLAAGTHANLSLSGTSIIAAVAIPAGTTQEAIVFEETARRAVKYPVAIATADVVTTPTPTPSPSPNDMFVAGSRIMTQHDTQQLTVSGGLGQIYQQFLGTAGWDGTYAEVGYINARNVNGRIGYIANGIPIEGACFMIVKPGNISATGVVSSARFVPITFGGAVPTVLPTGSNPNAITLLSDRMKIDAVAGDLLFLQTAPLFTNVGDAYCPIVLTGANFAGVLPLGERWVTAATSQAAKLGTIVTANAPQSGGPIGAVYFAMTNCPNPESTYVGFGDSIWQGAAVGRDFYDDGGAYGGFKQAMNSPLGGGRKHYIDCGTFTDSFVNSSPIQWPFNNSTPSIHWAYKSLFDKSGKPPFRKAVCQHGHNQVGSGLDATIARFTEYRNWFYTTYNLNGWVQFGTSTATTPGNNSFQTNEADQVVNAGFDDVAPALNAYFASGANGLITAFIPSHTVLQNGTKFKEAGLLQTTLVEAIAANTTSLIKTAIAIPRGTLIVFEPGDATNVDAAAYVVKSSVANGAAFDTQIFQVNGFDKRIVKPHAAGAIIKEAPVPDKEHWSSIGHMRVRDFIINNNKAAAFV